jgi:hypothetical protein
MEDISERAVEESEQKYWDPHHLLRVLSAMP